MIKNFVKQPVRSQFNGAGLRLSKIRFKFLGFGMILVLALTAGIFLPKQVVAQDAESFGYGSRVPDSDSRNSSNKNRTFFILRGEFNFLIPTDGRIIRADYADTLNADRLGVGGGVVFGASLNHATISQFDLMGNINFGTWGGTITGKDGVANISGTTKIENWLLLAVAAWRPLLGDQGLISPFLSLGFGMNIVSMTQNQNLLNVGYDRRSTGVLGVTQLGLGFDYFITRNFGVGAKYEFNLPFGADIELGKNIDYRPSGTHNIALVVSAKF